MVKKIKLLIADDHHLVREGFISCLALNKEIIVVGEAENGFDALNKINALNPDVVLLDLNMPDLSGLEALPLIKNRTPHIKVLILTAHHEIEYLEEVKEKGADGFLVKNISLDELNVAISKVFNGEKYFYDKNGTNDLSENQDRPELSQREHQILNMLFSELSTKDIADKLSLSIRTVDTHRENIKKKFNVTSMIALLKAAIKSGYVEVK
jgi:two-component system nitrate/nitrite response regulator NarL